MGFKREVMAVAYYHTCARCGCTMDVGEGVSYPGEGRVCKECVLELDMEEAYRKQWAFTKAQMEQIKKDNPGFQAGMV